MRGLIEGYGRRPDDVVILDLEASIEHLSRGTLRYADVLLAVAEPYYRSLETVGRTLPLAAELGVPHVWVVANKVRSNADEAAIREYCARRGAEVLGIVPFDEHVVAADRDGAALLDEAPEAPAVAAFVQLMNRLEERLGIPERPR